MTVVAPTADSADLTDLHPSDSAVQREIESVLLQRFGDRNPSWVRVEWRQAASALGLAPVWAKAEPDAVWRTDNDDIAIAEAYSRVGILNEGQKRKLAKDALKLLALQHALPAGKRLKCFLLVPDELVPRLNGDGWFPLALRVAADIVSVPLTEAERQQLLTASDQQALGQSRTRSVKKAGAR